MKKQHSSIKKPEKPQRYFIPTACFDIVSDNKALLNPADLVEPLPFSAYSKTLYN